MRLTTAIVDRMLADVRGKYGDVIMQREQTIIGIRYHLAGLAEKAEQGHIVTSEEIRAIIRIR